MQETVYLVTFNEDILNGKFHFLCKEVAFSSNDNSYYGMIIPLFM